MLELGALKVIDGATRAAVGDSLDTTEKASQLHLSHRGLFRDKALTKRTSWGQLHSAQGSRPQMREHSAERRLPRSVRPRSPTSRVPYSTPPGESSREPDCKRSSRSSSVLDLTCPLRRSSSWRSQVDPSRRQRLRLDVDGRWEVRPRLESETLGDGDVETEWLARSEVRKVQW